MSRAELAGPGALVQHLLTSVFATFALCALCAHAYLTRGAMHTCKSGCISQGHMGLKGTCCILEGRIHAYSAA